MDLVGLLGLGANIGGGLLQANAQAKARKRAMRLIRQLIEQQGRDFATAQTSLRAGQEGYRADPRRAAIASSWQKRLASPDVISPEMEGIMRGQTMDAAGAEGAAASSQLNEELQRRGLGSSGVGVGARTNLMRTSLGRGRALNNQLTLDVTKTNRAARDDLNAQYDQYVQGDLATEYGFSKDLASLMGSKSYGSSAMYAGV